MKSKHSSPLWTVTKFEFIRQVKKPSFWATILLVPVMVVGIFLISMLTSGGSNSSDYSLDENTKIVVTDEAGVLPKDYPVVAKISETEGRQKVISGEADLYFYIPANFEETKTVKLYHISEGLEIFNTDGQAIKAILNQAVSAEFSELEVMALTGSFTIDDYKLTSSGEESRAIGQAVIPAIALIIFFFFVTLFGGRLLMTVVEEKENRISEMILTSVSAKHLIVGKVFSMMLLGSIQIAILVIPTVVMAIIFRDNPVVNTIFSQITIEPVSIISNLALLVFSIFLVTGALTYIGTITPTAKDASQFIGPAIVGTVMPLYFVSAFLASTPSGLVYFLTYFPLSAPTAMMLRSISGTLTTPELIIGLIEITILSIIIIKITVKSFQKNAINFSFAFPKFFKKS